MTFAVPAGRPVALRRDGDFAVLRFENEGGGHDYGEGFDAYYVSAGMCSCGLFPAAAEDASDDAEQHLARLRKKYERKGWGLARIERALAAAGKVRERRRAGGRPGDDVVTYLLALAEEHGEVRFLCHFHEGSFTGERFDVAGPVRLTAASLASGAAQLERDHLYVVGARGG